MKINVKQMITGSMVGALFAGNAMAGYCTPQSTDCVSSNTVYGLGIPPKSQVSNTDPNKMCIIYATVYEVGYNITIKGRGTAFFLNGSPSKPFTGFDKYGLLTAPNGQQFTFNGNYSYANIKPAGDVLAYKLAADVAAVKAIEAQGLADYESCMGATSNMPVALVSFNDINAVKLDLTDKKNQVTVYDNKPSSPHYRNYMTCQIGLIHKDAGVPRNQQNIEIRATKSWYPKGDSAPMAVGADGDKTIISFANTVLNDPSFTQDKKVFKDKAALDRLTRAQGALVAALKMCTGDDGFAFCPGGQHLVQAGDLQRCEPDKK